ncbi:MAG: hypothetical protein KJO93_09610 [Muriicola sp.]|nr:hypothetical protein [Muriicola sp.]MBT8291084.1 hypothetical protein [Muriicola sp.]
MGFIVSLTLIVIVIFMLNNIVNQSRTWFFLAFFSLCFIQAESQQIRINDLYGTWVNTGSFKDGEQLLVALKDTAKNPMKYYFTFNTDGSFSYDVVSLKDGLKGTKRKGNWQLSPNRQRITLLDDQINPEEREIPGDFINLDTEGSLANKPIIFPIMELTPKKLVLYDEYHKTLDIFRKE